MADTTYALVRRNPQGGGLTAQTRRLEVSTAVTHPWRWLPLVGHGYLAGSFPDGITSVEGVPGSAIIRVLYRPESGEAGDGAVVAEVQSNPDGTWLVEGLDHRLKYDVICRHEGYNDMILSNVSPALVTGLEFAGSFTTLDDQAEILLGTGPYQVDVVAGTPPLGVSFTAVGNFIVMSGTPANFGQFTFTLRVIDSNGLSGTFESVMETFRTDPHWDKVVALLHFDGNLNDEAGGEWAGEGYEFEDSGTPLGLMLKTGAGKIVESQFDISLRDSEPYTLEFFLRKQTTFTTATPVALYQSQNNRLGLYFNDQLRVRAWYNANVITVPVDMYELHHYALVGMGNGQIRLYVDGIWDGLVLSRAHDVTGKLKLGGLGNAVEPYDGLIGELRVTKGVARYTENFTPPTEPFPNQ